MKRFDIMILKSFIPVFLTSLIFFTLILELVDLFSNLWRYLDNDVTILEIINIIYLYLPKCVSFTLPIALLFSIAFTLGNYYSNNELISIFGAGVPLFRFVLPLIICGFLLSGISYFFEENVVINTFKMKNTLSRQLLNKTTSFSNTNITVLSNNNLIIYYADYYNDTSKTLSGLIIIEKDLSGSFKKRIDAGWAVWKNNAWEIHKCRIFTWDQQGNFLLQSSQNIYTQENLNANPATFRRNIKNIDELKAPEAKKWIDSLKKAGLSYRKSLIDYYKRFSLSLTPFIVALISCSLGGKFKKNILLMSLLVSLTLSVIYYVLQMVTSILANIGYLAPILGAWSSFIVFSIACIWLFRIAKT